MLLLIETDSMSTEVELAKVKIDGNMNRLATVMYQCSKKNEALEFLIYTVGMAILRDRKLTPEQIQERLRKVPL